MRRGSLLWFTLFAGAGLAVLIGLGVWQLQRLEWKEGLIARIEAHAHGTPITLEQAERIAGKGRDPSYTRVRVEGRFHHPKERHLYALSLKGEPGWHVITPLETVGGDVLLVDRGFVPESLKDPASRLQEQVKDVVSITGLVRTPEPGGLFSPDNDERGNRWFTRDLAGMARSMFPDGTVEVAPFFIEAEASEVPGGWPKGGQTRLQIPNNHLQYAITWFALAGALVVIYALYVRGVHRQEKA